MYFVIIIMYIFQYSETQENLLKSTDTETKIITTLKFSGIKLNDRDKNLICFFYTIFNLVTVLS